MNRKAFVLSVISVLLILAACTPRRVEQQLVVESDPVSLRLAAAADRASTALQTLASIEQVRTPGASIESANDDIPQELRRTMSLEWSGPIEPLLRRLADRAGYRLQLNGNRPAVPIIISVSSREKSVVEMLRDVGLQSGKRADVVIDVQNKVVELDYAPIFGD